MKKEFLVFLLVVGLVTSSFSQNKTNKWTVAISGSLVNFGDTGINSVGDNFLFQVPKISLSRYIVPGLTLDVSTTISTLKKIEGFYSNNFDYFSVDGAIRYDFGAYRENLVPYIGIGMGIIGGPQTIPDANTTSTTNFLLGGTFWFSSQFGFNGEIVYKYSPENYESMRSHTQASVGLVYSFKPRQMSYRLWHKKR